jgi:hypothetical protein
MKGRRRIDHKRPAEGRTKAARRPHEGRRIHERAATDRPQETCRRPHEDRTKTVRHLQDNSEDKLRTNPTRKALSNSKKEFGRGRPSPMETLQSDTRIRTGNVRKGEWEKVWHKGTCRRRPDVRRGNVRCSNSPSYYPAPPLRPQATWTPGGGARQPSSGLP